MHKQPWFTHRNRRLSSGRVGVEVEMAANMSGTSVLSDSCLWHCTAALVFSFSLYSLLLILFLNCLQSWVDIISCSNFGVGGDVGTISCQSPIHSLVLLNHHFFFSSRPRPSSIHPWRIVLGNVMPSDMPEPNHLAPRRWRAEALGNRSGWWWDCAWIHLTYVTCRRCGEVSKGI